MSFKYKVVGKCRFGNELEDILNSKGISNHELFLNPIIDCTEDETLFTNIELAKDCLLLHLKENNSISLVVDCDVDGYTSSALIYQYLKRIKPDIKINVYIHHGKIHGLSEHIKQLISDDSSLIIVPDAGTGDVTECAELFHNGKDVIILDHHDIKEGLNNIGIVVNNQLSEKITNKSITGVGVVYKFVKLLDKHFNTNFADDYLDLVTLGMIADRADLSNLETRYYVLEGLRQIQSKIGNNKLIQVFVDAQSYSMNNKVTINGLGFYVCPLINSMIRLGEYDDKVRLFEAMCNSDKNLIRKIRGKGEVLVTIQEYVLRDCQSTNRKQKKQVEETAIALDEDIKLNNMDKLQILICNAKDIVDGNSTGLVANKISDIYTRPILLLRNNNGLCRGSGRGNDKCSIDDFNKWCKETELFNFVEGHKNAFGCEIPIENIEKLINIISQMESINEPMYSVIEEFSADLFSSQIIKNIAKYNYVWGNNISEPLFIVKNIPCNKYHISLSGARDNIISFNYHDIKFVRMNKGRSLREQFNELQQIGDFILFDMICRFDIDYKNGNQARVIIEDWIYKMGENKSAFGV